MAAESTTRNRYTWMNRREALGTVAAGLAASVIPAHAFGKMEKPALAGIGAGGKGRADLAGSQKAGFSIVGLVDVVDAQRMKSFPSKKLRGLADVRKAYPDARFFMDYREMLSELGDKVDAVTVSTPDHHHYHASMLAMKGGKHVYCQKPLTHGIFEARKLAETAQATGVKTQMGNQAHANDHMRDVVEAIQSGIIGRVKEIHAWTNRPIWPQGFAVTPEPEKVPEAIDWKQWIGPAPKTAYSSLIAPFAWRGWWNYGTGALGDMACHIMDMGYWAMGLPTPESVVARQVGATKLSPPINSIIEWTFGESEFTVDGGFRYHWYDGFIDARFQEEGWKLVRNGDEYNHPSADVLDGESFRDYGSVVIGEKGKLFFNRSKGWTTRPGHLKDDFKAPDKRIHRAGGNNYAEWLDAVHGKIKQSESHFGQSGPLTETVLLGVLAQHDAMQKGGQGSRLAWDADNLKVAGRPDLGRLIRRPYANGWQEVD